MAILNVGPNQLYHTIAAAMAAAAASDTILLETGYSNETATVTHPGMTVSGGATSTGIILQLGTGIATFFLAGTAPINVLDSAADGNGINGNDGDNVIIVTGGADAVSGGLGTDRLVVDYRLTSGAITGNSTTNFADAGGLGIVTVNGGFEHFTVLTGSGADTLTTGAGDDIINTGEGASTVTAGAGANRITGGSGADTVTALDGGNFIDGGGGDNTLTSGGGNDEITGGLGVDTIVAGGGDDLITVHGGADTSNSGAGNDRLIVDYSASTTAVTGGVTAGSLISGYSGHIADLAGNSIDFLTTENFTITTGSGNDVITTGDGDDVLDGGAGSDQLNGGGGSDTLLAGLGNDTLDGGANSDTVRFSGARANYQVNDLGDGVIQIIDLRSGSPDGADTLTNMEGFVFTDGTFDATSVLTVGPTLGGDLAIAVANGGTVIVTAADLTATDADSTNAQLVYTVTGTLHGTVLLAGIAATSFTEADILANAVSFQHDGNASNGSFTVSLTDGTAAPQVATVIATAGNAVPSAMNDALSAVAEDSGQRTILGSTLTGNDSAGPASESGQTLTVTAVSNVVGGSASVSGGNVLFTPTAGFNGAASFDYTVTDNGTTNGVPNSLTATATASFTVTEVNDAPSATSDALSAMAEDSGQRTILGSTLTGNDSAGPSNESGQTLTVTGVANVVGGSASVSGGNVLFTPTANFNGAASFDYTVTDNGTTNASSAPLTATATASFTVGEVNDAPSATNDALSAVAEDSGQRTILGSTLTGNDSAGPASESGQTLTVTAVSNVIGGSASVSGGNVLFTPTANFNGAASFDYTVTDNGTTNGTADPLTATPTASFAVSEVNDAPSATNDVLGTVAEDSGQRTILGSSLTGNDNAGPSSESGQSLTVTAVSNVIGGSASVSAGNVLFTPTANFNGAASFDYTVTDNGTTNGTSAPLTSTATASFTVGEVNDTPSATNDGLSAVPEDSDQRTILGSTLTGDDSTGPSNESGQTLTVTAVSNVVGGSASVTGGNVLFTPTANFNGAASFDYTVTDNGTTNGTSAPLTATATASFTVTEVNDTPSATNDALSAIAEDSGQRTIFGSTLTGNDSTGPSNESGQTLTVTGVANVVGGSAIVSGGNVLFTPTANFNGTASFDYIVTDNGTTNGTSAPLTASATASFTVGEVNNAPSAANDGLSAVAEDSGQRTILGSNLTGNDSTGPSNESGQTLTVTGVNNVVGGSASVSGGNVLFTPTAGFNGAASFDYIATDNGTTNGTSAPLTATATASFTVTEVNDAPSATNDTLSAIAEDSGQRTILGSALTGNDGADPSNESGQTLTVTAVSNVIGGSASVSGGNVLFIPTAGFNGAASFDYTVTDNGTTNGTSAPLTATASASFNINAVSDAPMFTGLDNNPTFTENGSAAVVLDGNTIVSDADLGSASPIPGATLTLARTSGASPDDLFSSGLFDEGQVISLISGLVVGMYTLAEGTLTVTFSADAVFADVTDVVRSLTYVNASDSPPASVQISYQFDNGEIATGAITVAITAVNDAPTISAVAPASYQPGTTGIVLSPGIALADLDGATLTGATVSLNAHDLADLLSASAGGSGIAVNYNASTGVLTLTGSASLDTYRQVLATVTYSSSAIDPTASGPTRTVSWQVSDGSPSASVDSSLDFFPIVDLDQSAAGTGFATTFTEGGMAVAIADTDAHIIATASGIASATVVLTNALAGDSLSAPGAALPFTIDNSVLGRITLTFSGNGNSPVDFETALHQVVFGNSTANVDPATRDVSIAVSDDNNTSNTAHATITISAANDPGSATNDSATTVGNAVLTVAAAAGVLANDSDPDGLAVVTGNVATGQGGSIQFASDGSYTYTPATDFVGTDTVGYTAQDPFGSQVSATLTIEVNQPPTIFLVGTAGDDNFAALPGNEHIDAGTGIDAVSFGFRLVDAMVSYVGNTVVIDGPSSHTVLTGFEIYTFADGTVNNNDGSALIDDLFYNSQYHDVWNAHVDADAHYNSYGWHEWRDPSAFFSTAFYLAVNQDVMAAGMNPLTHFDQSGWSAGRIPSLSFDPAKYLTNNPDVAAAHIDPLEHFLHSGAQEGRLPVAPTELIAANGFDYVYYLEHNPDVLVAHLDPFQHFQTSGWHEGRNPNALFDTSGYLATYADVAAAHINPLDHYHNNGWTEGRDPSVNFDTTSYLAAYPDVAAAHMDPVMHFLQNGIHEGRSPFADGVWG